MANFLAHSDYDDFVKLLRRDARFVPHPQKSRFVEALLSTAEKRIKTLESGSNFWRAQTGAEEYEQPVLDDQGTEIDVIAAFRPLKSERMRPIAKHVRAGRSNPAGIAYLYLADDHETALGEMRPWFGATITLSHFQTNTKLRLVDCSEDPLILVPLAALKPNPPSADLDRYMWGRINEAFSRPVTLADDPDEYLPTQALAEAFRNASHDGLVYKSLVGKGHSIVLFNPANADIRASMVYRTKSVRYEHQIECQLESFEPPASS